MNSMLVESEGSMTLGDDSGQLHPSTFNFLNLHLNIILPADQLQIYKRYLRQKLCIHSTPSYSVEATL